MPHDEPTVDDSAVHATDGEDAVAQPREAQAYEPSEQDDAWPQEPGELPRRPRRRLLTPAPLALLGLLLVTCGFIGGVLVEKGQSSASASTAGPAASLASRFRALRAGTGSTVSGGASASSSGFTRPTAGTVAYLAGSTLYMTDSEGNTVKVTTSPATSVTKTLKTSVKGIHPGETVTVTGATGADGALSAESISVGSGGALAALLGGSGGLAGGAAGHARSAGSAGAEPSLFGSG